MKQQPVIIIGMHRSGTSLLSRILEKAGIFMGVKKEENNEALFFLKFNDWVLKQANATWDNPYCFNFINDTFISHIKRVYDKRQKSMFAIQYLGFQNYLKYREINNIDFKWGWKDPRNTFTLDIWKEIYPGAKILHIYRNPVDVAQSLKVRAEKIEKQFSYNLKKKLKEYLLKGKVGYNHSYRVLSLEGGFELWKEYVEKAFQEKSAFHVKYEDLLQNPKENMGLIFDFLKLGIQESSLEEYIKEFNSDRRYAFRKNPELVCFYKKLKNDELVQKLGYSFKV